MIDKGRPVLAAFQFLSRFPVKADLDFSPELLRRSVKYYPVVGAAIGLVVWLFGALTGWAMPSLPAAVLTLTLWVWLTGGLHLDGWMDSADALLSYRSRERMLEIMKDSRVGAMGVIACILLLLLKASLIFSLLSFGSFSFAVAMLAAPVWSRWFMVWAMFKWPTAREGEGLAGRFRGLHAQDLTWSTVLSLVLTAAGLSGAVIMGSEGEAASWISAGVFFVLAPLLGTLAGHIGAGKISSRLGGLTGDTYGALNEGLETLLLLLAVIILN